MKFDAIIPMTDRVYCLQRTTTYLGIIFGRLLLRSQVGARQSQPSPPSKFGLIPSFWEKLVSPFHATFTSLRRRWWMVHDIYTIYLLRFGLIHENPVCFAKAKKKRNKVKNFSILSSSKPDIDPRKVSCMHDFEKDNFFFWIIRLWFLVIVFSTDKRLHIENIGFNSTFYHFFLRTRRKHYR